MEWKEGGQAFVMPLSLSTGVRHTDTIWYRSTCIHCTRLRGSDAAGPRGPRGSLSMFEVLGGLTEMFQGQNHSR